MSVCQCHIYMWTEIYLYTYAKIYICIYENYTYLYNIETERYLSFDACYWKKQSVDPKITGKKYIFFCFLVSNNLQDKTDKPDKFTFKDLDKS
jgi:hypothetical protein